MGSERSKPRVFAPVCALLLAFATAPSGAAAPPDVRFTSPAEAAAIPFDLVGNHVLLSLRLNGSEPLWFLLDSGAATIVGAECAERLALATTRGESGVGVGGQPIAASTATGVRLGLQGVEFVERRVVVTPLGGIASSLGHPVDGILGNSILRRAVVTVDYDRRVAGVFDPATYRYTGRGTVVPLVLDGDLAFARATVKVAGHDPSAGLFEIDSGGGHAVILNAPFVREKGLLAGDAGPRAQVGGLGGSMPARLGRLEWLRIGASQVDGSEAIFSEATSGLYASAEFDGNIGADVLRQFVVTYDFPHARLMLDGRSAR